MKKSIISFILILIWNVAFTQFKTIQGQPGNNEPVKLQPSINLYDHSSKQALPFEKPNYESLDLDALLSRQTIIQPTAWDRAGNPIFWKGQVQNAYNLNYHQQADVYLDILAQQKHIEPSTIEFTLLNENTDDLGMHHMTFQQSMNGILVDEMIIKLHAIDGILVRANGHFTDTQEVSTNPTISEQQAIDIVQKDLQDKRLFQDVTKEKFLTLSMKQYQSTLLVKYIDEKSHLVFEIDAQANLIARYLYYIDALSGEVLKILKNYCEFHNQEIIDGQTKNHNCKADFKNHNLTHSAMDGPATATAVDLQGITRTINTYEVGPNFYLIDASRPMFQTGASNMPNDPFGAIWTIDAFDTSPENTDFNYDHITSSNNSWNNKTAVSAHYNGGEAYEYFKNTFNRNSINGTGGNIISLINVADADGSDFDNAFWNGQAMFYGNGNTLFTPLAEALDVAGHEMSHGVIQATANLTYQGESGALNESFADIFGTMIDRDDWKLGEDVVTSSFPSGALRDMEDPHNGGFQLGDQGWQPKHVNEQYTGTQDNGGVHINSGIPNHAYYLFAEEIGKDKAEQVFYRALTQYLSKSSKFIDLRAAVEQSASDLYGNTEKDAATDAFVAVGIGGNGSVGGDDYEIDLEMNPGDEFVIFTDDFQQELDLAPSNDVNNISVLANNGILSKPSATDDGSFIIYAGIDDRIHLISINWVEGTFEKSILDNQPIWRNAIISKDAKRMAAITTTLNNNIHVYDFDKEEQTVYELYNPTFTEGVNTGNVDFADAMEFDYSGNFVMYDAKSTIEGQTGEIEYWDIGFLEVFDDKINQFGSGSIQKLFSQLPEDVSVGNPAFSKNSPYIIAFDYLDIADYKVFGANIESNEISEMFINNTLSYPGYDITDQFMIFTFEDSFSDGVGIIGLESSKINVQFGSEQVYIEDARLGQFIGNGIRDLDVSSEDLEIVEDVKITPNPTQSKLQITSSHNFTRCTIYSVDGAIIQQFNGKNLQQIDLSTLQSGAYILRLFNDQQMYVHKVIKI